nr:deoxyribonuclease IV [Aeropyrum pernix]
MCGLGVIRFGPAGKPVEFKGDIVKVPEFLRSIGLDALEYEAVRGVRISEAKARRLGEAARENGVILSMHAPYYVNLSSPDDSVVERSIKRLYDSMIASEWMGSYAVVVHPGYYKGLKSREEAVKRVIEALNRLFESLPSWVKTPWIAPETMGKQSQVGSLEETVEICLNTPRCRPCVDWAHLYARAEGRFVTSVDQVVKAIEYIESNLGREAVNPLHTHFSKIEYGKGGERMHHTLQEEGYGPDWRIVCRAYRETGINAVVISESPILEKDALLMKSICKGEA